MEQHHPDQHVYTRLAFELAGEFVMMYLVMYTMIASLDHFYVNINNAYMTMMMVAPMAVVMLISMRAMFPDRRLNIAIVGASLVLFLAGYAAMRTQAGVGDAEFLRSMIPHHSGAILMCRRASLTDPDVIDLCKEIVKSQEAEIAAMRTILARHQAGDGTQP